MRPGLLGMIETGITSYTNRMNIGSPATMGLPSRPRSDLLWDFLLIERIIIYTWVSYPKIMVKTRKSNPWWNFGVHLLCRADPKGNFAQIFWARVKQPEGKWILDEPGKLFRLILFRFSRRTRRKNWRIWGSPSKSTGPEGDWERPFPVRQVHSLNISTKEGWTQTLLTYCGTQGHGCPYCSGLFRLLKDTHFLESIINQCLVGSIRILLVLQTRTHDRCSRVLDKKSDPRDIGDCLEFQTECAGMLVQQEHQNNSTLYRGYQG
jgi:hypothetical protein